MTTLKKDFKKRLLWQNNRASAIFPIFAEKNLKTYLVFQNYWKWKNNQNNVFCIFRIRNSLGEIISINNYEIKEHNEILINDFIDSKTVKEGSVEIEFISPENLGYPFPAVLAFYETKNHMSVVHSSGRILNSNEDHKKSSWKESNFLCRFEEDFSPFVSVFFGQNSQKKIPIKFKIINFETNVVLIEKKIVINSSPFGSKNIFLKEVLSEKELIKIKSEKVYLVFDTKIDGIFGRFVVGNFNKKVSQPFVTHSFQVIGDGLKDITQKKKKEITSFLPLFNEKPLNLLVRSYPTNMKSNLSFYVSEGRIREHLKDINKTINFKTGGPKAKGFEDIIEGNTVKKASCYESAPSRININYSFFLKNSLHPTDLATGFKSRVYPPKRSHWGAGVSKKNFITKLFLRNMSHKPHETKKINCKISIWNTGKKITKSITIKPESCSTLDLNFFDDNDSFFSWKAIADGNTLEVFWVSYNTKNGAICAEHSF
jgi:hypothetical protein